MELRVKREPDTFHYITSVTFNRVPVFRSDRACEIFVGQLGEVREKFPYKLIGYVVMPDHFHLITNPRDGRIKEFVGALKSLSAKSIVRVSKQFRFSASADGHQIWQESFKAMPLWTGWMIWQKINYIHANPVKAGIVKSAKDYRWSSSRSFYSQSDPSLAVDHDGGGQMMPRNCLRQ